MGYRKVGSLEQLWYVICHKLSVWFEWQDAKCWAREYHPGWLQIATKSKSEEARAIYKEKILTAYRGE